MIKVYREDIILLVIGFCATFSASLVAYYLKYQQCNHLETIFGNVSNRNNLNVSSEDERDNSTISTLTLTPDINNI
jgi:hypothetical protein